MKERIISASSRVQKNLVKNRFLPVPESVSQGLEPEPKISDFELIKELGTGSFGRVFLVSHKKTKAQYAIKAIDKRNKANQEEKPYFRREIEIMYKVHHPNVVKLYGHFEDNNFCYFVMEYISKGNIYNLIPKNNKKKLNTQLVCSIMKDVISAVYFLHHMSPPIVHRDIKPENVLLAEGLKAKLTDFGWSNYLNGEHKRSTVCGTPIYLAPEMINETGHDERVDIWCIGVLLFELITGSVPFLGNDLDTLKSNIRKLKIAWPRDISKDAQDLISKILRYNPDERLPIEEMMKHQFFLKYFPDAENCLIKPDKNAKYKVFIISEDDPKTWDPLIKNNINFSNINNTSQSSTNSSSINNAYIKKNNTINNYQRTINLSPSTKEKRKKEDEEKYNYLLKKYDYLKKEFYALKNSKYEVEKLKNELVYLEQKIEKSSKKNINIGKNHEIEELNSLYNELKDENYELKERIKQYQKYLNENQNSYLDNNFNEVRESIKGRNKNNFINAVDRLKLNLDEETKKNFNAIIKAKDRQIEKLKDEERLKREREKQKFATLLNKYDRTLSWEEKENKELKYKLKELEKQFS